MSTSTTHLRPLVPVGNKGESLHVFAHWNNRTVVNITGYGDVGVSVNLSPEQARQLARELDIAAEVAEREAERMAEARIEAGHLLAEVSR